MRKFVMLGMLVAIVLFIQSNLCAVEGPRRFPLSLKTDDVIPTGNEWISLPDIRVSDGALGSFNVLSMRDRGLLQVNGEQGTPVLQPFFVVDGKPMMFRDPKWELIEYWIPTGSVTKDGLEATITYCAPAGARGAFVRLTLTNRRDKAVPVTLGAKTSFGSLSRVTYTPVELRGQTVLASAPWVDAAEVFSFITHDTYFSWSIGHVGATSSRTAPPLSLAPEMEMRKPATLAPGETVELNLVLGAGIEEFSSSHVVRALTEMIDRGGSQAIINQAADWCRQHTRTTGKPDLDLVMNRNFLFTAFYAWGKTFDTEQFVGVTSRSPRYYVSAAYWDRDAMLWSFPALLDTDRSLARAALEYALTTQLRNTGTHSRFIDGLVLEDGFQLDEAVAPVIAIGEYYRQTKDAQFVRSHRQAIDLLRERILERFDATTGLYSTMQDSQDEYQKLPFSTYSNVLTWRALNDFAEFANLFQDAAGTKDMRSRADALKKAIMEHCAVTGAPGASGPIFANSTDGQSAQFVDVPPGSLMKLPALGFLREDDPIFDRTYQWLHSKNYSFSYFDQPFGLPGSYRLPITTSWEVADHLQLTKGRAQALKILRSTEWDGGIVSEGLHPEDATLNAGGGAFATAAGYVAHSICAAFCTDSPK
jgi:hypothetical protein